MALAEAFNLDTARRAPQTLAAQRLQDASDWLAALEATGNPKFVEAAEDAFLKQLKLQTGMGSLYDAAVVAMEKSGATPDRARQMTGNAGDRDGIEGLLRKRALIFTGLSKLRGPLAHPAIKSYAGDAAALTDDDYKNLLKPLKAMSKALGKTGLPSPAPAMRGWAGDKPKTVFK